MIDKDVHQCVCLSNRLVSNLQSLASVLNNYQFVKVNYGSIEATRSYGAQLEYYRSQIQKDYESMPDVCNILKEKQGFTKLFDEAKARTPEQIDEDYHYYIHKFRHTAGDIARYTLQETCGW